MSAETESASRERKLVELGKSDAISDFRFSNRRQLIEKIERLVQVADDKAVNTLIDNIDEFQEKADLIREIEALKKK